MRYFSDDLEEEFEDGNLADEGPESYTEEDLEDMVRPIIIRAILDGELPSTDHEFSLATQEGLELGLVVETRKGLALARDIEEQGLELGAYQKGFDSIRGFGKSLHAPTLKRSAKRLFAKTKGRAGTAMREGMAGAGRASRSVKSFVGKHPTATGIAVGGIAAGALKGLHRRNPVTEDAERRASAQK